MNSLLTRLRRYAALNDDIFTALWRLPHRVIEKPAGQTIVTAGERLGDVFVVEEGWAIRYRILDDGRRQIVNFMLPGDCFDLQALVSAQADHYVSALTAVRLRVVPSTQFLLAMRSNAELATVFWWAAVQEESILREHIVRIGRRTARERVSHLVLELQRRLLLAGVVNGDKLGMPLTRDVLADALGLSPVHVSRTLAILRMRGLIDVARRSIRLKDPEGLAKVAGFNPSYLHVQDRPALPGPFDDAQTA